MYREIYNMIEVTHEKLQRLNRIADDWNGNQIPSNLFQSIYDVAAYNPRSRNQRDMGDQEILYIEFLNSVTPMKQEALII